MKKFYKTAFSLIEISIVILVIGVAIAGISQGIELYQDARLEMARRHTKNSPINVIEDLTLWFESISDGSFEKTSPKDGERIALWKNINSKALNKINVSQATQGYQPVYVKRAINNMPALRFDNSQVLFATNLKISDIVGSSQATVFIIQNNFCCDYSTTTFGWSNGGYRFQAHIQESGRIALDYGGGNFRTATGGLTNFLNYNKVITFVKNGGSVQIRVNSQILANGWNTASINESLYADFAIGKYPPDNAYYFYGYIGEFIVFKRGLSDAEVKAVEQYLSKKWSIQLN